MPFIRISFPRVNRWYILFVAILLVYFFISLTITVLVYLTSKMVVDEQFHIPLGISYCKFDFSKWDPKVTTLPGVYLITAAILGPFGLCSTFWLRAVNLIASTVNIFLLFKLFGEYEFNMLWHNAASAFTLALLPPMYFFVHLYYTDIISITMVLAMLYCYEQDRHYLASIFGMFAIVCRQTNVIWILFIAGRFFVCALYSTVVHRCNIMEKGIPIDHVKLFIKKLAKPWPLIKNLSLQFWLDFSSYAAVLITFGVFVIYNGGIVVGDKTAHEATIHLPQMFYFSLFSFIFAWPHFVGEVINFVAFVRRHKLLMLAALVTGLWIVHVNTLVHPYMLADNRHYTFYVWNRFYGRYVYFRYLMVPIYLFAWYVIIVTLFKKFDLTLLFFYMICTSLVLIPQKLIEVRYYFIPYILFRLNIQTGTSAAFNLVLECISYILMNYITFNLFFTKTILWDDYQELQRILW